MLLLPMPVPPALAVRFGVRCFPVLRQACSQRQSDFVFAAEPVSAWAVLLFSPPQVYYTGFVLITYDKLDVLTFSGFKHLVSLISNEYMEQ